MSGFTLSNEVLLSVINSSPVGMMLVDENGEVIFANHKSEELFASSEEGLIGTSISDFVPNHLRSPHKKLASDYMLKPSVRAMGHGRILPAVKQNGEEIQVELGLTPVVVEASHYVLVSIVEASNPIIRVAAFNDSLTGLPNKNLFKELSENLRNLAIRKKDFLSLMFIDLDGFKGVNDTSGHDVGDYVLCRVADILRENVRKNDIAGRIGGDEFLICLYGIEDHADLVHLAESLIKKISAIQNSNGDTVNVGASIGAISTRMHASVLLDDMIKKADTLMYKAKNSGKGKVFCEAY